MWFDRQEKSEQQIISESCDFCNDIVNVRREDVVDQAVPISIDSPDAKRQKATSSRYERARHS